MKIMETCLKLDSSAFVADAELIKALEKKANPVVCDQKQVLFSQGAEPKGLYILHQGGVLLTMQGDDGETVMCMEAFAGSIMGLPGLVGNEPYSLTATARQGSSLSFIEREDFLELMRVEPQLSFKVLHILAAEVRAARMALR